jgi:hypothetical protein
VTVFQVENNGADITSTNWFDSAEARAGKLFMSCNGGAFRVLVPDSQAAYVAEMRTGRDIVVSRGLWPAVGLADAFELLFDDHTDNPFALQLGADSFDRIPVRTDEGKSFVLSVWTRGPVKQFEKPCRYRRVERIPCLKPWAGPKR